MNIEDLEFEKDGRYVRLSIDDELTEGEYDRIYAFLHAIIYDKTVPELKE